MPYGIQELDRAYADGMEDLGQKIIELLDEAMAADEEVSPTRLIEFIEDELSFDPVELEEYNDEEAKDLLIEYFMNRYSEEAVQS